MHRLGVPNLRRVHLRDKRRLEAKVSAYVLPSPCCLRSLWTLGTLAAFGALRAGTGLLPLLLLLFFLFLLFAAGLSAAPSGRSRGLAFVNETALVALVAFAVLEELALGVDASRRRAPPSGGRLATAFSFAFTLRPTTWLVRHLMFVGTLVFAA